MMQIAEPPGNRMTAVKTDSAPARPRSEKVIIIGAGVAGLSCGCYLQMNGFQTEILEAGELPGGLCTAWRRGRYVFDGCLRWLMGALPPSIFHKMWRELGAIGGRKVFVYDDILSIETPDGKTFTVPSDLDRLAGELRRLAPEDRRHIDRLFRDARRCIGLEPPDRPVDLMPPRERMRAGLRYLPMVPIVLRWKNLSLTEYLARYKNEFVRRILQVISGDEQMSALVLVMVLAFRTRKDTGFVAGGSWDFAMAIADRYERLGGIIRYNSKVTAIQTEGNRAAGVQCEDGTQFPASMVISCADGYTTIFKMLGGRFVNGKIRYFYEKCETFSAIVQVSLGIRKEFPGIPHALNFVLSERISADGQTSVDGFEAEAFGADSGLCPKGTTMMTVRLPTQFQFWMDLKKDDPRGYRAAKKNILRKIVDILDKRYPGLAENIERFDVATPATYVRYTGNWRGSYEGWLPTPRVVGRRVRYTLPGLKNFYMAGHWVVPGGGLPSAALSGREVAQLVCAQYDKVFTSRES